MTDHSCISKGDLLWAHDKVKVKTSLLHTFFWKFDTKGDLPWKQITLYLGDNTQKYDTNIDIFVFTEHENVYVLSSLSVLSPGTDYLSNFQKINWQIP